MGLMLIRLSVFNGFGCFPLGDCRQIDTFKPRRFFKFGLHGGQGGQYALVSFHT